MKKIICICLLVIATLGAYLFVRNNQHIVMDVRYVLDTEIVDDKTGRLSVRKIES